MRASPRPQPRTPLATLQRLAGKPIPPAPMRGGAIPDAALFFRRFQEATKGPLHAERFDYEAARLWATATNPPILADQSSLIRRLLARRRSTISTPLVTSHEEQDPYYGRFGLNTLVNGEYGLHQIVNQSHPHLNAPPTTLPPRPHCIHICWGVGWAGATLDRPRQEGQRYGTPAGSVLQALVALLADDWRAALAPLPVHIELHPMNPIRDAVDVDRGRRRWSASIPRVPPAPVVAAVFERANYLSTLGTWQLHQLPKSRKKFDPPREWWCAVLLEADLTHLGFVRSAESLLTTHAWNAPRTSLPREIDHVIVMPVVPREGMFYRVRRSSSETRLAPQPNARTSVQFDDYWNLRVAALDLALSELAARMG